MSRIAVLGAGAWGTALALSLARRGGHQLALWAHSPEHAEELTDSGENLRYLPGFVVPLDIHITAQLPEAIQHADVILCVTPAQALRSVMEQIAPYYKEKMEGLVGKVTKMLEPLIIVGMGSTIAGLMLAIYMPMFEMAGAVK